MRKGIAVSVCVLFALLFGLFCSPFTWAATEPKLNRPNEWRDRQTFRKEIIALGNVDLTDATVLMTTGQIPASYIADVVREVWLPLTSFMVETGGDGSTVGTGAAPLTASTTPGMEIDDNMAALVWADGETSPIQVTFKVPGDYSSGGAFYCFATESNSTTPNQIDFDVYTNTAGSPSDAAATNQTPAALTEDTATPSQVILTVATDFASLAAGDRVTLRLWRDNVAIGTGDLELKDVVFYYTATQ